MRIIKSDVLLSIAVSTGMYSEMLDEIINLSFSNVSSFVCLANVHTTITAFQDRNYASIIKQAEIVTPDGMPLTWALRLLFGIKQQRVCGMDILPDLIKKAENLQIPVFFYGGTLSMLDTAKHYLEKNYPQLKIAGSYSPPFRKLSYSEENELVETINNTGAKMVFVVLGCPKQEKWIASMKNKIKATMIGVGGAMSVFVGLQKRAPLWMQKSGLEWFFRLMTEPKRLFKRYFVSNFLFIMLILNEFILVKIFRKKSPNI